MPKAFWFRKDLRLADHPALHELISSPTGAVVFATADQVGQPFNELSQIRQDSLTSSWYHLNQKLNGDLIVLKSPGDIVPFCREFGISEVTATQVFDTNGLRETSAVASDLAIADISLKLHWSNYAVNPGKILKNDGTPYKVFTPFYRAWSSFPKANAYIFEGRPNTIKIDDDLGVATIQIPEKASVVAGEDYAMQTLQRFTNFREGNYDWQRDRADIGGTSHLSHALSHGEIHPRTILQALGDSTGSEIFAKELAWREFYADVLYNNQDSLNGYLDPRFTQMAYSTNESDFERWKSGNTGFPMVDAGMRQLLATGWMHNRVRMIVASFLVKDLHIEWTWGAKWFEENLSDFDPASNSHGWQWTAGCGTDASPYFRVFNPISQGLKFDPNGEYVRKYIPELKHLAGAKAHEPWLDAHGYSYGYVRQMVDHAAERLESLKRYESIKNQR